MSSGSVHTPADVHGGGILAHGIEDRDRQAGGFEELAGARRVSRGNDPRIGHQQNSLPPKFSGELAQVLEGVAAKNEARA